MLRMSAHLTPLEVLDRLFGGLEEVSRIAGYHPKNAYKWRHPSKTRAAGDLPSASLMRALLVEARARGIPLEHRHLIDGADAAEIDALTRAPTGVAA